MTAYRQQALACASALSGGPRRVKDLRADIPDAGKILLHNVYGWFDRAERGIYVLTDAGHAALKRWPQQPLDLTPRPDDERAKSRRRMTAEDSLTGCENRVSSTSSSREPAAFPRRHVDCENPLRLVFFEQWADRAAGISRPRLARFRPCAAASRRHTIELYELPDWRL